jgi:hypothetical protein
MSGATWGGYKNYPDRPRPLFDDPNRVYSERRRTPTVTDDPMELSNAEIRTQLRFLRIQERTANVENTEAIARKIAELEARLD